MQLAPTDNPFDIFSKINTAISEDNILLFCSEYVKLEKSVSTGPLSSFISEQTGKFLLTSNCLQRYRQLNAIDCVKLSDEDRASLALFIEKIIHNGTRETNVHLKKTAFSHPLKLPYSLQYNCDDKSTFLLLKRAGKDLLYSIATKTFETEC